MVQLRLFAVILIGAAVHTTLASLQFPWLTLGEQSKVECATCVNETMTPVNGSVIKISNNTNVSPLNRTGRDLMGTLFNTTTRLLSSLPANNVTNSSASPLIDIDYISVVLDNLTSSLNKTLDPHAPLTPMNVVHPLWTPRNALETAYNASYLRANAMPSVNSSSHNTAMLNAAMSSNSSLKPLKVSEALPNVSPQVRSKRGAAMHQAPKHPHPAAQPPMSSGVNETSPRDINILVSVVRNPTAIQNINFEGNPSSMNASNGFGSSSSTLANGSAMNSSVVVPLSGRPVGIMIRPVSGQYPQRGSPQAVNSPQGTHRQTGTPHSMRPNFNMPTDPLAMESSRKSRSVPEQDFIQLTNATRAGMEDAFLRLKNTFGGIGDSLKQLNETLRSFSTTLVNSDMMKNLTTSLNNSEFIQSLRSDDNLN